MKYKKISFSLLAKIEKFNTKKEMINLKHLYLKKKQNNDQLKLLSDYQKEYIEKMSNKMQLGIQIYEWENYNNFLSVLQVVIKNSINFIDINEKMIAENIQKWSQNHIKMQVWNHLNIRNKKRMLKIKKIQDQTFSDYYSQYKVIRKGLL